MQILLATLHYYALAIGFSGVLLRLLSLNDLKNGVGRLQRLFLADNLWGISALLWIATGLIRAFGGFEKGSEYYLSSPFFILKMLLFGSIFLLEIYPMMTLIRWRISKLTSVNAQHIPAIDKMLKLTAIELILLSLIPVCASLMARGY